MDSHLEMAYEDAQSGTFTATLDEGDDCGCCCCTGECAVEDDGPSEREREQARVAAEWQAGPEPYEPGPYTGDDPDWGGFCGDGGDW